jgi:3-methyl-2-oxobutanoate hydroxymethyltransferase
MPKLTVKDILSLKGKRKIVAASCFGYYEAKSMEEAGLDILVSSGGFINPLVKGNFLIQTDELDYTLMALEGVRNGAPNTFIFAPLPFGDNLLGINDTLRIASRIIKGGADAVSIAGSGVKINKIKRLTSEGIPCCGHIGLVPWYTTWIGGYKSQGKKAVDALKIYKDALEIQKAGAVWIEMECVPYKVAGEIAKRLKIPILGIGSGPLCDGEIQVHLDSLGLHDGHYPKHSRIYFKYHEECIKVFKKYREEVIKNEFPTKDYGFEIEEVEFQKFMNKINSEE